MARTGFSSKGQIRILKRILLFAGLVAVVQAQNVKVEPEVNGYAGDEVLLRCNFAGTGPDIKVTQAVWAKNTGGKKQNIAVYHPTYGVSFPVEGNTGRITFRSPSLNDATLIINPLKNEDDGLYSCEFATYPNGNEEGTTQLNVLVKPIVSAEAVPVNASTNEAVVAVCTAASGKPPAEIRWESSLPGNFTSNKITNANGTTTVTSQYRIIPQSNINQKSVACIVEHKTMKTSQSLPVTMSVQYPPVVSIKGYDDNWHLNRKDVTLHCEAEGNPPPSKYEWKLLNGTFPGSTDLKSPHLKVSNVDENVNGTIVCEVTNGLGTSRALLHVMVREVPEPSNAGAIAGGVIGAILGLLLIAFLVVFFMKKRNKDTKGSYGTKTRVFGNGPTTQGFSFKEDYDVEKPLSAPNSVPLTEEIPRFSEDSSMEKPKYELTEEEEEERFNEVGPMLRMSPHYGQGDFYADDDMESQRDGSIISKTAVYV